MTELTLRSGETLESGLAFVAQLIREMFRATPLGIAFAIIQSRR